MAEGQVLFNIIVGLAGVFGGWILNNISRSIERLDRDVRAMPLTYVTRVDYRADIDAFVAPQPYPSWVLDENAQRQAPVQMPEDAGTGEPPKMYSWDEETQSWVEVPAPEA